MEKKNEKRPILSEISAFNFFLSEKSHFVDIFVLGALDLAIAPPRPVYFILLRVLSLFLLIGVRVYPLTLFVVVVIVFIHLKILSTSAFVEINRNVSFFMIRLPPELLPVLGPLEQ